MRSLLFYILCLSVFALLFLSACDTTDVQEGTLRTNLNAPTLLQPQVDQTLPSHIAFKWTPVEGATHYDLELDPETPNAEPSLTSTVAPFHHSTLEAAGKYTWRVRALDAHGRAGYWSKRRHLTVMPR